MVVEAVGSYQREEDDEEERRAPGLLSALLEPETDLATGKRII